MKIGSVLLLLWLIVCPVILFVLWFNEVGRAATWPWEACVIPWGLTLAFGVLFGFPEDDDGPGPQAPAERS